MTSIILYKERFLNPKTFQLNPQLHSPYASYQRIRQM